MNDTADSRAFASDFVGYMNEACTAFHAVEASRARLLARGFVEVDERDAWALFRGGKYFFVRNTTTLIAFAIGGKYEAGNGYTVLGAHTDSPCLRLKPVPCLKKNEYLMLNTQPYGGGLWHTWFDRDLGIAGRVVLNGSNGLESRLVRIDEPVARIPNLAIHLTSGKERESFEPNLHEHAKAILTHVPTNVDFSDATLAEDTKARLNPFLLALVAKQLDVPAASIADMELQLIDVQPSCVGGASGEFIFSGRLDNLCSAYQCVRAITDECDATLADATNVRMIMLFDHEEVGSASCTGAGSSLFMNTLQLINQCLTDGTPSALMRSLRKSFVVSIDMAHGLHPNYPAKHDSTMAPKVNLGLVIKHNANQRYATNAVSASLFRACAKAVGAPVQEFTVRSDAGCGSTIGPVIATLSGILTVDCGSPQYSMHSIREMMGAFDAFNGYLALRGALLHHPALAPSASGLN